MGDVSDYCVETQGRKTVTETFEIQVKKLSWLSFLLSLVLFPPHFTILTPIAGEK